MRLLRQILEFENGGAADRPVMPCTPGDGRSDVRSDRAILELKRGRPILLSRADTRTPMLLAAAVETLDADHWTALQRWSDKWWLTLSAERLSALGIERPPDVAALRLPGKPTLDLLRHLAAVTQAASLADVPDGGSRMHGVSAAMQAAMTLARRAQLMPACVVARLPARLKSAVLDDEIVGLSPDDVLQGERPGPPRLRRLSEAAVALKADAECRIVLFGEPDSDAHHVAVVVGKPDTSRPVPTRLHSSCLTGDVLGSLHCDCGEQLRVALDRLASTGGVLLYLAQEGRGIGLANKLRAYRLQASGLDTFAADRHLGFAGDLRDFTTAAAMLESLGIRRISLLTNNPHKVEALQRAGIDVADHAGLAVSLNPHNERYVATKRDQAGHLP
jgi:GTP cyclohydrolase II